MIPTAEAPLSLSWSAEGKFLAYTARVSVSRRAAGLGAARNPRVHAVPAAVRRGVFIVPASGGAPRQISAGPFDFASPAWMLDSQSVVAVRGDSEIVSIPVEGGAVKVLAQAASRFEDPLPSPDGRKIAWMATAARPQSYNLRRLWVMNADGSRAKELAGALDRDPQSPQWSSDSRTVYFLADDRGATHVYAAHNDGTVRQATTQPERLHGFSLADNGRAASVRSSATRCRRRSLVYSGRGFRARHRRGAEPAPACRARSRRDRGDCLSLGRPFHPGLDREAALLRPGPQVSAPPRHSGRSAPNVWRRNRPALAGFRRARLGRSARQPPRHSRLRRGIRQPAAHTLPRR